MSLSSTILQKFQKFQNSYQHTFLYSYTQYNFHTTRNFLKQEAASSMPGTIQISVLDIQNLPSSSPTSSTSIKVTMGRKEYQTRENPGEFSIPLTNLRDNLVFHILDADGNEIAHADVETRLVVEKGHWDDHFPLEGGGLMHLKMHFALSEEEHNRIRMMRLSALKKTHGQLLNSTSKGTENASDIGRRIKPSLGGRHGRTSGGLQVRLLDTKDELMLDDPGKLGSGLSGVERVTHPVVPNHSDGNKTASPVIPIDSVGGRLTGFSPKNIVENIGIRSPPKEAPTITSKAEEALSLPPGSKTANAAKDTSLSSKLEKGIAYEVGIQGKLERSPSNDMLPHTRTLLTKPQSSETVTEVPTSNQQLKESKRDTSSHYSGSKKVIIRKNEGIVSTLRRKFSFHKEVCQKEEERSTEVPRRESTSEVASTSGREHKENLDGFQYLDMLGKHREPDSDFDMDSGKGIRWKESWKTKIQRVSTSSPKPEIHCGNKAYSHEMEMSRAWIFPDEPRKPCVVTGGEQATLCMEEITCPKKTNFPAPEKEEEHLEGIKNDHKDNKGEMTSKKQRNPDADRPAEVDIFGGPVGQVMKVAIMVGFGVLVFMTRQKNNR